jgi:hypothetical protein
MAKKLWKVTGNLENTTVFLDIKLVISTAFESRLRSLTDIILVTAQK